MSLSKIRELREQRAKLAADMQALIPQQGKMSKEDRAKFDQMDADQQSVKDQIDVLERAAQAEAETRDTKRPPESQPGADGTEAELRKQKEEKYAVAFRDYLRNGQTEMSAESRQLLAQNRAEFRDMGIGTNTLGGYFVPQGFVYKVEEALKYFGDMLNVAEILDTATGQPLPYPTDNDTTVTGEIVGEGKQVSTADVNIGHINFGAYKFSTKMIKLSLELLQDSAFDMEAYLQKKMATRLGRILNTKFTVGSGSSEPTGIVTATVAAQGSPQAWGAGSGVGIPVVAGGSSANDGGDETGGSSIGWADLVNVEHSIDPLYRKGSKWMMHDTTLRFFKTLLDKYGRPLWVPGVTANAPDTILTYPYSINNDMATIATNAKTVLFGQLDKYLIRRVKELGILRLNERFADYGQVAFIGFARYDGNLLDAGTHPVNYLQQAAS